MKPVTITQPYKATGTAGHPIEEWLDMTPLQQTAAHLEQMRTTAQKWSGVHWRESMGVPATVPADAQTLLRLAESALDAIRSGDDKAMLLAMKATAQAAELNRWCAIDTAVQMQAKTTRTTSKGGKAAGEIKKAEMQQRIADAVRMWHNMPDTPPRNRASIIARRMGVDPGKVRGYLRKADVR